MIELGFVSTTAQHKIGCGKQRSRTRSLMTRLKAIRNKFYASFHISDLIEKQRQGEFAFHARTYSNTFSFRVKSAPLWCAYWSCHALWI